MVKNLSIGLSSRPPQSSLKRSGSTSGIGVSIPGLTITDQEISLDFRFKGIGLSFSTRNGGTVGVGVGVVSIDLDARGGGGISFLFGLFDIRVSKRGCSYVKRYYMAGVYTHTETEVIPECFEDVVRPDGWEEAPQGRDSAREEWKDSMLAKQKDGFAIALVYFGRDIGVSRDSLIWVKVSDHDYKTYKKYLDKTYARFGGLRPHTTNSGTTIWYISVAAAEAVTGAYKAPSEETFRRIPSDQIVYPPHGIAIHKSTDGIHRYLFLNAAWRLEKMKDWDREYTGGIGEGLDGLIYRWYTPLIGGWVYSFKGSSVFWPGRRKQHAGSLGRPGSFKRIKEDDVDCCFTEDDRQRMVKISKTIGVKDYPITYPKTLQGSSEETTSIQNISQLIIQIHKYLDETLGQWPIHLKIPDTDLSTPGNQESPTISLPNIAELLAELYGAELQGQIQNSDKRLELGIAAELESLKKALFAMDYALESIIDYFGFKDDFETQKLKLAFTPRTASKFMNPSEENVRVRTFNPGPTNPTLVSVLNKLLVAASHIQNAQGVPLDYGNIEWGLRHFFLGDSGEEDDKIKALKQKLESGQLTDDALGVKNNPKLRKPTSEEDSPS